MDNPKLFLVNVYDGDVQGVFDDADQLISYLKEKDKKGELMGEGAFEIFFGRHLQTSYYWERAFNRALAPNQ